MALRFPDDPLYQTLREEKITDFNQQRSNIETLDFHDCDFRGLDLRNLNADGINFSGSYFRGSDLRGIDFRNANMDGVSLATAKVSGCFFAKNIDATEIAVSVDKGIRIRVR